MTEKWEDIRGYEGSYRISNRGRVKSLSRKHSLGEKILKPFEITHGYLAVNLSRTQKILHRLVAEYFILNPENKSEINHKDGDKKNNNIDNLEWCTHKENMRHAVENGFMKSMRGELCGMAKLNKYQVQRMRLLKEIIPKTTYKQLAKLFNVHWMHTRRIIKRERWAHL